MPLVPSLKRLVETDYPAEQRRLVQTVNAFLTDTSSALGSLPAAVVREFTLTMPDAWTTLTLTTPWLTLYGPVGYTKGPTGLVSLRGVMYGGTYSGTTIFTLPLGYRPSATRYLAVAQSSVSTAAGLVQVMPSGDVVAPQLALVQTGASAYLSLDGLSFDASDTTGPTLATPPTLSAGDLSGVTGLVCLSCVDVTSGTPVGTAPPTIGWSPVTGGVRLTSLVGLSSGRRYTLRVALLAG